MKYLSLGIVIALATLSTTNLNGGDAQGIVPGQAVSSSSSSLLNALAACSLITIGNNVKEFDPQSADASKIIIFDSKTPGQPGTAIKVFKEKEAYDLELRASKEVMEKIVRPFKDATKNIKIKNSPSLPSTNHLNVPMSLLDPRSKKMS